jgi:hypothetical protein
MMHSAERNRIRLREILGCRPSRPDRKSSLSERTGVAVLIQRQTTLENGRNRIPTS